VDIESNPAMFYHLCNEPACSSDSLADGSSASTSIIPVQHGAARLSRRTGSSPFRLITSSPNHDDFHVSSKLKIICRCNVRRWPSFSGHDCRHGGQCENDSRHDDYAHPNKSRANRAAILKHNGFTTSRRNAEVMPNVIGAATARQLLERLEKKNKKRPCN
jgi:hypothetical protein